MTQIIRYSSLHAPEPVILKPGPGRKHSVVVDERSPLEQLTNWFRQPSGLRYRRGRKLRRPLFEPIDLFWIALGISFGICVLW
jgi:hypothetical protein